MEAAKYYNSRPKKSTGAGVLFFNGNGELLIVKPSYLDRWLWPGGGIEENETPLQAAMRESKEEIGIVPEGLRLAFVQYRPPKSDGQDESIHFVFVAALVDDDFLETLRLDNDEIVAAKFVTIDALPDFVSPQRAGAVCAYVRNNSRNALYIENGVHVA